MENAVSYLNVMPNTKAQIKNFANQVVSMVESGNENALKVFATLKGIDETCKAINKQILAYALDEAEKYSEKTIKAFNCEITKKEVGVKYDYSVCNDAVWNRLNERLFEIKDMMKAREKMLKSINGSIHITDEDTGEIAEVFPPAKTSTSSLSIKLNNE